MWLLPRLSSDLQKLKRKDAVDAERRRSGTTKSKVDVDGQAKSKVSAKRKREDDQDSSK